MFGEEPALQIAPVKSPQMVSTVKLPILKKGEYTLWSMRMEQYLTNTDYSLWQVILNGDGPIQVTTDEKGIETEVLPKTAQALLQRQRERKAKSIFLFAILDEYQLRFHRIKDAKSLWAAIKSRFEGLDKAYDSSTFIIEHVALICGTRWYQTDLDIDDLYNNLKVFEADIKGSSGSSLNSQNVAFLSIEDTTSSNEAILKGKRKDTKEINGNRNRDAGYRSRDNTRRTVPVETSDALVVQDNALIVQDGLGYDLSYIAQDEPTEFALMAYI
ncbi:hypothetical protein Tco_0151144 [Tanacetum coccineum]